MTDTDNKKIALIICVFIIVFMLIAGLIALSGHLPVVGKGLAFIFAALLVIFVIAFFAVIARRKK